MFTRCKNDGNTGTVKRGGGKREERRGGAHPPLLLFLGSTRQKKKQNKPLDPIWRGAELTSCSCEVVPGLERLKTEDRRICGCGAVEDEGYVRQYVKMSISFGVGDSLIL